MKRFKKFGFGLLAVFGSLLLIMCGPSGMSMVGDAMVDVGHTLSDSGRDATSDAAAQDCATSCTSAGVQRIMTADTDPNQIVTGVAQLTLSPPAASPAQQIVAGPLILTDVRLASPVQLGGTGSGHVVNLFIANDCSVPLSSSSISPVGNVANYTNAGSSGMFFVTALEGVRLPIPDGSYLCGFTQSASDSVRYVGFRPYD